MTTVNGPVDEVGRWALCKLRFLQNYLGAYTTIMKEQNRWCRGYHYVDANAGSGRPKLRDEEVYIDGSPRVALSITHPFTSYTFIDLVPWRLQRLEALRGAHVEVTLDIAAHIPDGAPEHVVRTVTENGRTLKFTSQGFEEE